MFQPVEFKNKRFKQIWGKSVQGFLSYDWTNKQRLQLSKRFICKTTFPFIFSSQILFVFTIINNKNCFPFPGRGAYCLSKNANMFSNFMSPYIRGQNALNPKKIHRQIWSTKTHVDKGKWLELDPGAQCDIIYRTWYFDCRSNVDNYNNVSGGGLDVVVIAPPTIYMYQVLVWRWLWSDPPTIYMYQVVVWRWLWSDPLLSICIMWWFGGGCDLTPYYLYVSGGGLEVVVIWPPTI